MGLLFLFGVIARHFPTIRLISTYKSTLRATDTARLNEDEKDVQRRKPTEREFLTGRKDVLILLILPLSLTVFELY